MLVALVIVTRRAHHAERGAVAQVILLVNFVGSIVSDLRERERAGRDDREQRS